MVQQILQNPEVRKYTNQATDSGVKLLFRGLAWATWGVVSFIKEMFRMVAGK